MTQSPARPCFMTLEARTSPETHPTHRYVEEFVTLAHRLHEARACDEPRPLQHP